MNGPKVQIGSKQFRLVEDGDDNNLKLLAEAETVFVEETSLGSQLPRDFLSVHDFKNGQQLPLA